MSQALRLTHRKNAIVDIKQVKDDLSILFSGGTMAPATALALIVAETEALRQVAEPDDLKRELRDATLDEIKARLSDIDAMNSEVEIDKTDILLIIQGVLQQMDDISW